MSTSENNDTLQARVRLLADTVTNWNTIHTSFVPDKGEVVVFLPDNDSSSTGIYHSRFKVGDGKTTLALLAFADDWNTISNISQQLEEATDTITEVDTSSTNHIENKNNPHAVTIAQTTNSAITKVTFSDKDPEEDLSITLQAGELYFVYD